MEFPWEKAEVGHDSSGTGGTASGEPRIAAVVQLCAGCRVLRET
jgi:hypothetical protein